MIPTLIKLPQVLDLIADLHQRNPAFSFRAAPLEVAPAPRSGSSSQRINSSAILSISSGTSSSAPRSSPLAITSINWVSSVQGESGGTSRIPFSPYFFFYLFKPEVLYRTAECVCTGSAKKVAAKLFFDIRHIL